MFHGKIHYFYGDFPMSYVKLPEGFYMVGQNLWNPGLGVASCRFLRPQLQGIPDLPQRIDGIAGQNLNRWNSRHVFQRYMGDDMDILYIYFDILLILRIWTYWCVTEDVWQYIYIHIYIDMLLWGFLMMNMSHSVKSTFLALSSLFVVVLPDASVD